MPASSYLIPVGRRKSDCRIACMCNVHVTGVHEKSMGKRTKAKPLQDLERFLFTSFFFSIRTKSIVKWYRPYASLNPSMVVRQARSNYLKKGELASEIHISMVVYAALKLCYSIVNRRGTTFQCRSGVLPYLTPGQSIFFLSLR